MRTTLLPAAFFDFRTEVDYCNWWADPRDKGENRWKATAAWEPRSRPSRQIQ